jgi:hypothetical protein
MNAATIFNREGETVTMTTNPAAKYPSVLEGLPRFAEMIIALKECAR